MAKNNHELSVDKLRRECDPKIFKFKDTSELETLDGIIGQERTVRAMDFGVDIKSPGYNVFALGRTSTGKRTTVKKLLEKKAAKNPTPSDWCYVNNFDDTEKPKALKLPAGKGCQLKDDMQELVKALKDEVPEAFESKEYQEEVEKIKQNLREKRENALNNFKKEAENKNFTMITTSQGVALVPKFEDKEGSLSTLLQGLGGSQHRDDGESKKQLEAKFSETMQEMEDVQQRAKDKIKDLDKRTLTFTVDPLLNRLKKKYKDYNKVIEFLNAVQNDILENSEQFKKAKQMESLKGTSWEQLLQSSLPSFDQYEVNLIVDNCDTEGAPVVIESNPTYQNLVGKVEYEARLGALITNFGNIRAGALHKANGGYLMVEARKLLTKPFSWEALKRVLQDGEIRIEQVATSYQAFVAKTLQPEPIPLNVKVVITGDPLLYYLLYIYDKDFQKMFKVKVDFSIQTDWKDDTVQKYVQFIGTICENENLKHFTPSGVAQVVEEASRIVSDQGKLATKFGELQDVIRESSYWATKNGNGTVQGKDVQKALDEKIYRSNKIEERLQEMIDEGTILIDTEGEVTGQVNGISVLTLGDYSFGKPSRITARTYVGKEGVVNIDRETELGGRIHNKGVLILTGYLGGKYAQEVPLSLGASIAFEQLYEEVEGDSASSAELYTLLSSLSGYPIKQDFAVTGSVNQHGQVQAIGGVNEKIEGYFRVCKLKGLTGKQGVVIPQSNVKNLMLNEEVIGAVKKGRFHIHAIKTVNEGIEILTGKPAGELENGSYPKNTVNWAVQEKLKALAEKGKEFRKSEV